MASKFLKYLTIPTTSSSSSNNHKVFSGPIVSLIPKEVRVKKKKNEEAPSEPTSPRVSCIGQVKRHKNKHKKIKNKKSQINEKAERGEVGEREKKGEEKVHGVLRRKAKVRQAEAETETVSEVAVAGAVGIGAMRKFRSGRETLVDFDWRKVNQEEGEEEEEILVPHSAPMVMGGGAVAAAELETRKEASLWRSRTLTSPDALQV